MSYYISRFLRRSTAPQRLISYLSQREGKLSSILRNLGLGRFLGGTGPRAISTTPVLKAEMADDMELVTGIAKREALLREAGCDDPWAMGAPLKRGSGRENDPTAIPSAFDGRLVGCICLGDRFAKWMWLEKGEPKRCECGHYFVLKHVPPV